MGPVWFACAGRSLYIWKGAEQMHACDSGNWVMQLSIKRWDLCHLTKYFQSYWWILPCTVVMQLSIKHWDLCHLTKYFQSYWWILPCTVHSKYAQDGCSDYWFRSVFCFSSFYFFLQAYIHKTGTRGVSFFDTWQPMYHCAHIALCLRTAVPTH